MRLMPLRAEPVSDGRQGERRDSTTRFFKFTFWFAKRKFQPQIHVSMMSPTDARQADAYATWMFVKRMRLYRL